MSLFRSMIQGRPLQRPRTDYDLPLYRTYQEPEVFPPPPITASVHAPKMVDRTRSPSVTAAPRSHDLAMLQRRDRYCQRKLQELLDAQSDGLMASQDGTGAADDEESLDTPTQTTYSLKSVSLEDSPLQPQKKKMGLGKARRKIWKTVLDVADIQAETDALLSQELRQEQEVLRQLEQWSTRESALKEKISDIESENTGVRAQELKEGADKLSAEIQELETKLTQMKTRHRRMVSEIAELDNSVTSKLSSYKSSLEILQEDVKEWMKSPPGQEDSKGSPFFELAPSRRTLDIAKEHFQTNIEQRKKQRRNARRERQALEEGAVMWSDVVEEIYGFERFLKDAFGKLAAGQQQRPTINGKGKAKDDTGGAMQDVLGGWEDVIHFVSERLEIAQQKDWKLLQMCIGNELEALRQGKLVFEQNFGINQELHDDGLRETSPSRRSRNGSEVATPEDEYQDQDQDQGPSTQGSSARDMFASAAEGFSGTASVSMSHSAALRRSMHEDDEEDDPDPELLFSRPGEEEDIE